MKKPNARWEDNLQCYRNCFTTNGDFSIDAEKASNKTQYMRLKKKKAELGMVGHSLNNKSYLPKISTDIMLTG